VPRPSARARERSCGRHQRASCKRTHAHAREHMHGVGRASDSPRRRHAGRVRGTAGPGGPSQAAAWQTRSGAHARKLAHSCAHGCAHGCMHCLAHAHMRCSQVCAHARTPSAATHLHAGTPACTHAQTCARRTHNHTVTQSHTHTPTRTPRRADASSGRTRAANARARHRRRRAPLVFTAAAGPDAQGRLCPARQQGGAGPDGIADPPPPSTRRDIWDLPRARARDTRRDNHAAEFFAPHTLNGFLYCSE
jgi:hypothetical protein